MPRVAAAIVLLIPGMAFAEPPGDPAAPPVLPFPAAVDPSPWPLLSDRRLKFQFNPAPFAGRYLSMPDVAPAEPRDAPFDARGQLINDGPNTKAYWNPLTDLDFAAGMRLTPRSDILLGFAMSARGRFTPMTPSTTPGGPSVYFLQINRKW
jgi:hypothetical protein